jgi:MFS transporter, SHS family, sialic acid transporter
MRSIEEVARRGRWLALTAALLGWMFDGLEMGLFPLVAGPALKQLLPPGATDADVALWFSGATAAFLVGAATGGVLFGWLGDRLGRVRAMTLSVLTYALFSGFCGLATAPWQIVVLRFVAALGMGGEWSLGVALVMEIWPNRSRAALAGLIGAAANFGYMLVAVVALGLGLILAEIHAGLVTVRIPQDWADALVANSGWRILLLLGATPALLTFFIRIFVPESERWQHAQERGVTSNWAKLDLLGVVVGSCGAVFIILLWLADAEVESASRWVLGGIGLDDSDGGRWVVGVALAVRIVGTLAALMIVTVGFLYPIVQFLKRSRSSASPSTALTGPMIRLLLTGACLSGVALLATWGSIQWAPTWANQLTEAAAKEEVKQNPAGSLAVGGAVTSAQVQAARIPAAKAYTQFWSALGAVIGSVFGALLGDWLGRRLAYTLLCLSALASTLFFYLGNNTFGVQFLASVCLAGGLSASFYGWLPLYLPELFPTRLRAIGQGFSFNFGRVLAAVGVLQAKSLMDVLGGQNSPAIPCSILSCIYVVGTVIIWFAPETRGKQLPE